MRDSDLTDTLKAAQEAETIDVLVKIVLTHGEDNYTYERDRILERNHPESPWSQTAKVLLDNSDGVLTDLPLQGFQAVISYGAVTPNGEEYSACAPLWVIAPRFDSSPGKLTCELSLIGIPNLLALDKASRNYIPDEDDTKTIKTLLTEIMGATLGCFSHCKAYDVVFDDEEEDFFALSLINTYKPKDSLSIYKGNSRLAIAKKLLGCTLSVMLAKADGNLHIFRPTITGEVFASEYSLESGHTFFSKAYRKALVIPNYIYCSSPPPTVPNWVVVTSDPYSGEAKDQTDIDKFGARKHTADYGAGTFESNEECATQAQSDLAGYQALHDPYYEGTATDPDSIAALATDGYNGEVREYFEARFENDAQAKDVAEARLAKYQLNAEMGVADVPLNVGAEVYDYIKVTDQRDGKERTGTMGSLTRHYNAEEAEWRMTFSLGQRPKAVDVMAAIEEDAPYFGRLIVDNLYAKHILAESLDMYWIDPDGTIDLSKIGDTLDNLQDGEKYARIRTLHLDAGILQLNENVHYSEGFDPTTKERGVSKGPSPPDDPKIGDLWIDTSPEIPLANIWKRWTGTEWIKATPADLDAIGDGTVHGRVLSSALTAEGLVVLDELYQDDAAGNFARVARTSVSGGRILLDEVEIIEGDEHYGLLRQTEIESGHIKLSMAFGDLDDIKDGEYGKVIIGAISALGYIKLSETLEDATYKRYLASERSKLGGIQSGADVTGSHQSASTASVAGHSLTALIDRTLEYIDDIADRKAVSANEKTGAGRGWAFIDAEGVLVNSQYGISIFSGTSFPRLELTPTYIAGRDASGVTQFYLQGSDGKAYAGAGAVILDDTGIHIKGEFLKVYDSGGTRRGTISGDAVALVLAGYGGAGVKLVGKLTNLSGWKSNVIPDSNDTRDLGSSTRAWRKLYVSSEMYIPAEA